MEAMRLFLVQPENMHMYPFSCSSSIYDILYLHLVDPSLIFPVYFLLVYCFLDHPTFFNVQ